MVSNWTKFTKGPADRDYPGEPAHLSNVGSDPLTLDAPGKRRPGFLQTSAGFAYQQARKEVTSVGPAHWPPIIGHRHLGPPWGRLGVGPPWGLTLHACIQSPGHSQDGPSNHAPTRSVCTAAAVASLRARFSHSCGINVSLASLGRYARTCERYHGLFSPGSRPTGSSQTLSASPTGLRARWACGLMVLGATKC